MCSMEMLVSMSTFILLPKLWCLLIAERFTLSKVMFQVLPLHLVTILFAALFVLLKVVLQMWMRKLHARGLCVSYVKTVNLEPACKSMCIS